MSPSPYVTKSNVLVPPLCYETNRGATPPQRSTFNLTHGIMVHKKYQHTCTHTDEIDQKEILMEEGFILLTRGYGFMGGCTPPLIHYKNVLLLMIWTWNLTGSEISLSRLALKNFWDHVVYSTPWGDANDVIGKRRLERAVYL